MSKGANRTPCVLITGGYGCIGAETAKWLLQHSDSTVVVASRNADKERSRRVFGNYDANRLTFLQMDVRNASRITEVLREHHVTHVAHLAGLQTPDCNANRDLGLQINLAGTQNLIEAMKATGREMERFVFASSIAVYGPRSSYPAGRVPMLAEPQPVNVYGTWKLAGEQLSRLFANETETPTISARPGVLFGPGRDAGLTATPTTAMKHVALGIPYEIPYSNRQDYLYAPDVGAAFGNMLLAPFHGYAAFTLPSHTVDTSTFVAAIEAAARERQIDGKCHIAIGREEVPFICDLDFDPFSQAFPAAPRTPLSTAIQQSVDVFIEQAKGNGSSPVV